MTFDKLKNMDKDDFLNMLGLETQRSTVDYLIPALALFGVGLLVGTGVGLLVAPRPGRELRADLGRRLQEAPEALGRIPQRASAALRRGAEKLEDRAEQVEESMQNGVT
jgi:hypothetical protein